MARLRIWKNRQPRGETERRIGAEQSDVRNFEELKTVVASGIQRYQRAMVCAPLPQLAAVLSGIVT